jgi:3-oxoacyl-[acyl-carrier-protein] synthase II
MAAAPNKRVAITGIGLVTPLGLDRETSWRGLRDGNSATRWLVGPSRGTGGASVMPTGQGTLAGAPSPLYVTGDRPDDGFEPVVDLALRAAEEAVADARLDLDSTDRWRAACVIGTSKGGLRSFARLCRQQSDMDADAYTRAWTQFLPNAAAVAVARRFDLRGAAVCPVAACATGLACLVRGADLIRDGYCDIVLAGSSDASLQEVILASFQRMGVLARGFDDPATACRPFDRARSGFLVGEGAAILVLEDYEQAKERGVRPYGEWITGAVAADHSGLTHLEPEPVGLSRLIQDVLRRAGLTSAEIDYANLHGTATAQNDVCETRALKMALGPAAKRLVCSGIKGTIGHLLGAAGSVETAVTLLAMRDGIIPPTVNLDDPDRECDLDYTPRSPQPRRIENALKLSLGFGGHLVAAVVRAV